MVFDDVEIPWENVLFYRHTARGGYIRATLHRYSMFPFVQRILRFADLLVGDRAAQRPPDRAREAAGACRRSSPQLACYREGINAHLTAAIADWRSRARAGC